MYDVFVFTTSDTTSEVIKSSTIYAGAFFHHWYEDVIATIK